MDPSASCSNLLDKFSEPVRSTSARRTTPPLRAGPWPGPWPTCGVDRRQHWQAHGFPPDQIGCSIQPGASVSLNGMDSGPYVFRDLDQVELGSRNERPMTRYFPELVAGVTAELPERCVIDGEIVTPPTTAWTSRRCNSASIRPIRGCGCSSSRCRLPSSRSTCSPSAMTSGAVHPPERAVGLVTRRARAQPPQLSCPATRYPSPTTPPICLRVGERPATELSRRRPPIFTPSSGCLPARARIGMINPEYAHRDPRVNALALAD